MILLGSVSFCLRSFPAWKPASKGGSASSTGAVPLPSWILDPAPFRSQPCLRNAGCRRDGRAIRPLYSPTGVNIGL
ncbi:hypothetical protein VTH06DRAFT_8195 [Thermothelomyces fergusii]